MKGRTKLVNLDIRLRVTAR